MRDSVRLCAQDYDKATATDDILRTFPKGTALQLEHPTQKAHEAAAKIDDLLNVTGPLP